MAKTHINAFIEDLQRADQNVATALSEQERARARLNERRAEEGLKPLSFDEEESQPEKNEDEDKEDDTPEEAKGFGSARHPFSKNKKDKK